MGYIIIKEKKVRIEWSQSKQSHRLYYFLSKLVSLHGVCIKNIVFFQVQ